jgi:TolB protein
MLDRRIIGAQYYIININSLSKISNLISDFIYIHTTTETKGIFDSKIAYVSETGKITERKKIVRIMDFNGDNNEKITDGNGIIIIPTFSKINKDEIFYLEYKNRKANFYKENIKTKQKNIIKINDGIIFAPNFNPQDNHQMILSIANEKGTNLFLLDMSIGKYSKITNNKFINTSPTFSPDGNQIVYVSDKTGNKQLHIHDIDTKESKQISKNKGMYDKPSWSPDGKLIAFVKTEKGKFKLGLMTPDGENERFITEAFLIEGLKWSPNSRYIIFSKQKSPYGSGSIPSLYMIDILTNREVLINTPENEGAVDPDWVSNS